jgi:hypothetical protein
MVERECLREITTATAERQTAQPKAHWTFRPLSSRRVPATTASAAVTRNTSNMRREDSQDNLNMISNVLN